MPGAGYRVRSISCPCPGGPGGGAEDDRPRPPTSAPPVPDGGITSYMDISRTAAPRCSSSWSPSTVTPCPGCPRPGLGPRPRRSAEPRPAPAEDGGCPSDDSDHITTLHYPLLRADLHIVKLL